MPKPANSDCGRHKRLKSNAHFPSLHRSIFLIGHISGLFFSCSLCTVTDSPFLRLPLALPLARFWHLFFHHSIYFCFCIFLFFFYLGGNERAHYEIVSTIIIVHRYKTKSKNVQCAIEKRRGTGKSILPVVDSHHNHTTYTI